MKTYNAVENYRLLQFSPLGLWERDWDKNGDRGTLGIGVLYVQFESLSLIRAKRNLTNMSCLKK